MGLPVPCTNGNRGPGQHNGKHNFLTTTAAGSRGALWSPEKEVEPQNAALYLR